MVAGFCTVGFRWNTLLNFGIYPLRCLLKVFCVVLQLISFVISIRMRGGRYGTSEKMSVVQNEEA